MTYDRPLAEVVAEGRAMCRPDWQGPKGYRDTFIAERFARLLAVAEAATKVSAEWPKTRDDGRTLLHAGLILALTELHDAALARLAQEGAK